MTLSSVARLVAVIGLVAAPSANAALMDVAEIKITSFYAGLGPFDVDGVSLPGFLQVAEVVAKDEFGVDQAFTDDATAAGTTFGGSSPDFAIDGSTNGLFPSIHHSATSAVGEMLTISFTTPFKLAELSIFGRTGTSESVINRDVYNIEIFNSLGQGIFMAEGVSAVNDAREAVVGLPGAAVIPVPAALPLFASALGVLGGLGWRRKRALA
ncbi:MAG: hypothetical protein AAF607_13245 [Pseudomonadota bacterium]